MARGVLKKEELTAGRIAGAEEHRCGQDPARDAHGAAGWRLQGMLAPGGVISQRQRLPRLCKGRPGAKGLESADTLRCALHAARRRRAHDADALAHL